MKLNLNGDLTRANFKNIARFVKNSIIENIDNETTKIMFRNCVDIFIDELEIALFEKESEV